MSTTTLEHVELFEAEKFLNNLAPDEMRDTLEFGPVKPSNDDKYEQPALPTLANLGNDIKTDTEMPFQPHWPELTKKDLRKIRKDDLKQQRQEARDARRPDRAAKRAERQKQKAEIQRAVSALAAANAVEMPSYSAVGQSFRLY